MLAGGFARVVCVCVWVWVGVGGGGGGGCVCVCVWMCGSGCQLLGEGRPRDVCCDFSYNTCGLQALQICVAVWPSAGPPLVGKPFPAHTWHTAPEDRCIASWDRTPAGRHGVLQTHRFRVQKNVLALRSSQPMLI